MKYLTIGTRVSYRDTYGEFTKTGTIESIYQDGITLYVVDGAAYAADELRMIA
jgi:hypothetical protein